MNFSQFLQAKDPWQFDITSALIGAAIAWLIVALIYKKRQAIKAFISRIWEPFASWRRKTRAGQGEKYLIALQNHLKHLLLFQPADPSQTFIYPELKAPPALPKTLAEAAEAPAYISVPYGNILDGAPRIVVTGPYGSGKTTALVMAVWESVKRAGEGQPFERLPVWIDLQKIALLPPKTEATSMERLTQLAALSVPQTRPKWLQQQLRKSSSMILIDNWDKLTPDDRIVVAVWIAEVSQDLPNSYWIITSDQQGYGLLSEVGFVPVKLDMVWTASKYRAIVQGWAENLGIHPPDDVGEVINGLSWAEKTDATPLEIALRSILFLKSGKFPIRLVDTLDHHLEMLLPTPNIEGLDDEIASQARMIALNIITKVAVMHRLENSRVSRQQLNGLFT
ncbi:MAG: hypothetical protein P1S60_02060, partial [Anaerolineae bacterium]|nr:hypothetical protein [Anaerolineae bacterium]